MSWLASVFAAWGIFAIGDRLYGARIGLLVTVLWAALPVGVIESMAYSESLFTAFAAWSLHAVLTRQWVLAGTLGCLAGLTRPLGVAVAAAVVLSAVRARHQRARLDEGRGWPGTRPEHRLEIGALLAPVGWVGYLTWVGVQT